MAKEEEKNIDAEQDIAFRFLSKIKEIAEHDFTKFSALFVVFMTVGLWIIKSMWYAYQSGRFSVYGIDSCYIALNDESVLLQIIQMVAVLVVWFSIDYLYYTIAVSKDETKFHFRRTLKLLAFWVVEMCLLFIIIIILSRVNIIELIKASTGSDIVTILIILAGTCFMVNIYGIEFVIGKKLANRKKKKIESKIDKKEDIDDKNLDKKSNQKKIFAVLIAVIITVAFEILIMYISGLVTENTSIA